MTEEEFNKDIKPILEKEPKLIKKIMLVNYGLFPCKVQKLILKKYVKGAEKMRVCSRCKRELPESEFYWDKFNNKFKAECKECHSAMKRHYYKKRQKKKIENPNCKDLFDYYCGGIVVNIPNYCKDGEYKYNIIHKNHSVYNTNNRQAFFQKLRKLIYQCMR